MTTTPALEEFEAKVRRIAQLRSYDVPLEQIAHETNTHGDDLRLLVVAADMYRSWER